LTQDDLHTDTIPICDYEGSDYRTRFWVSQGREYEDLAERHALRRLLPPHGARLLEVGTGFGRLADLYQAYDQIVLLDYSKSMLRQAQERLGRDGKYIYVVADLYRMPLADAVVDTACMVRVIHHLANVPGALRQIQRVLRPGGAFLLEFASKLHLKSILRYAFRRQNWSPFARAPIEFVELNFDFHPKWMFERLREQGFEIERTRTVSRFRIPLLKRIVPARLLAGLDGALQGMGALWQLTPSVFVRARRAADRAVGPGSAEPLSPEQLFRCPACEHSEWRTSASELLCHSCDARWTIDDGIYDFKTPAQAEDSPQLGLAKTPKQ
jgi:ubiquinone/menaquinone biosynthesis C-methylase UbiE